MGEHIRLESVWYNAPVVGKNGSSSIDPLTASRIDEGGYATIYRVPIQPGLPVGGILKVFKRFPEPYRAGERLRRKAKWGALYDEYDMLCALDGLDGHVPQAYACGFFVIDDGAGGVTYSPAFLMEEVDSPAETPRAVRSGAGRDVRSAHAGCTRPSCRAREGEEEGDRPCRPVALERVRAALFG